MFQFAVRFIFKSLNACCDGVCKTSLRVLQDGRKITKLNSRQFFQKSISKQRPSIKQNEEFDRRKHFLESVRFVRNSNEASTLNRNIFFNIRLFQIIRLLQRTKPASECITIELVLFYAIKNCSANLRKETESCSVGFWCMYCGGLGNKNVKNAHMNKDVRNSWISFYVSLASWSSGG
jgi:hypothetical protein